MRTIMQRAETLVALAEFGGLEKLRRTHLSHAPWPALTPDSLARVSPPGSAGFDAKAGSAGFLCKSEKDWRSAVV
jgi:hypothetical protein